jgi:hypothetical protein
MNTVLIEFSDLVVFFYLTYSKYRQKNAIFVIPKFQQYKSNFFWWIFEILFCI